MTLDQDRSTVRAVLEALNDNVAVITHGEVAAALEAFRRLEADLSAARFGEREWRAKAQELQRGGYPAGARTARELAPPPRGPAPGANGKGEE